MNSSELEGGLDFVQSAIDHQLFVVLPEAAGPLGVSPLHLYMANTLCPHESISSISVLVAPMCFHLFFSNFL